LLQFELAADGEGMFIIWCVSRRSKKKEAIGRKYSVHPCFNRSGELGNFVLVRKLEQDFGRF
jgi:hypothetical protein